MQRVFRVLFLFFKNGKTKEKEAMKEAILLLLLAMQEHGVEKITVRKAEQPDCWDVCFYTPEKTEHCFFYAQKGQFEPTENACHEVVLTSLAKWLEHVNLTPEVFEGCNMGVCLECTATQVSLGGSQTEDGIVNYFGFATVKPGTNAPLDENETEAPIDQLHAQGEMLMYFYEEFFGLSLKEAEALSAQCLHALAEKQPAHVL
jgi:hypothetical protein